METTKLYGPPGTGKTETLIGAVNIELKDGMKPYEIAYVSFTRVAAHEARNRALDKFREYGRTDFPWFSTIHSICFRLNNMKTSQIFAGHKLDEFGKAFGYEFSPEPDYSNLDTLFVEQLLQTPADYYEFFLNWQRHKMLPLDVAYAQFVRLQELPESFTRLGIYKYIERRNNFKATEALYDFCDLLEMTLRRQLVPPGLRVLVGDEMQDNSPLLYKVFELWSQQVERVYVAGDVYQALFGFCGGDPTIFMDMPADDTQVLKQSYRCSKAVHDLARKVIERHKLRYADDDFLPTSQDGEVKRAGVVKWGEISGRTFYLHRTRLYASLAARELTSEAIPFISLRGSHSPLQKAISKAFLAAYNLAEGHYVNISLVNALAALLPAKLWFDHGAKTHIKQRADTEPGLQVSKAGLRGLGFRTDFIDRLTFDTWIEAVKGDEDEKNYLVRLYRHYGTGVFEKQPDLVVSTIHGVKGAEAQTVILNPDITKRVAEGMSTDPDAEVRVFYVGISRASEKVVLLVPTRRYNYVI